MHTHTKRPGNKHWKFSLLWKTVRNYRVCSKALDRDLLTSGSCPYSLKMYPWDSGLGFFPEIIPEPVLPGFLTLILQCFLLNFYWQILYIHVNLMATITLSLHSQSSTRLYLNLWVTSCHWRQLLTPLVFWIVLLTSHISPVSGSPTSLSTHLSASYVSFAEVDVVSCAEAIFQRWRRALSYTFKMLPICRFAVRKG